MSGRDFWLGVALPTVLLMTGLTLLVFFTHGCSAGPVTR